MTQFWKEQYGNCLYDAVEVSLIVDVRDVRAGHYQLEFDSEKPGVSFDLTQPILPATYHDAGDAQMYGAKEKSDAVKEGHDMKRIAYSAITDEKDKRFKVKLVFVDDNMALSDVPMGGDPKQRRVKFEIVPYKCGTGITIPDGFNGQKELQGVMVRLTWKLVNLLTERPNKAPKQEDDDVEILKSFAGMNI